MATKKKAVAKKTAVKKKAASKSTNYLTKRILTAAAKTGFKKAAAETMQVMGYNVIAQRGWVVKKYADGRIVKINKLAPKPRTTIVLD